MKENKRDLAAEKTKKKILEAAWSIFVKKGFSGTSMSEIALKAKVNQSLIYHYYSSKEELWRKVKQHLVECYLKISQVNFDAKKGLKTILEEIVRTRLEFYEKNPDVLRMIGWQRLELAKERLAGSTILSPEAWIPIFTQLKKEGHIKAHVSIEMMVLFITSVITGAITENYAGKFNDLEWRQAYQEMIVDNFMLSFGT